MNYDFDFRHTCPIIDGAYEVIETTVSDVIENLIHSHFPDTVESAANLAETYSKEIMRQIKADLEAVRDSNIRMRDKAESQLREAEKDYDYMQDWKDQIDKELDTAKYDNKILQDEIEELKQTIQRYEEVHS